MSRNVETAIFHQEHSNYLFDVNSSYVESWKKDEPIKDGVISHFTSEFLVCIHLSMVYI